MRPKCKLFEQSQTIPGNGGCPKYNIFGSFLVKDDVLGIKSPSQKTAMALIYIWSPYIAASYDAKTGINAIVMDTQSTKR